MERSNAIRQEQKALLPHETWPQWLQDDPRWRLAQRVVSGSHFARSPLLTRFLLFVVAETLEGRGKDITEHQIGVHVFDRRPSYSTIEDNIVRNYARQLRKRLAEFFAGEGSSETLRIDIPLGGYVPVFVPASEHHPAVEMHSLPVSVSIHAQPEEALVARPAADLRRRWSHRLIGAVVVAVYSLALVWITWLASARIHAPQLRPPDPAHALWAALFDGQVNTYIVPADAGFNLLEDLLRRPLQLADYIKGNYLELPLAGVDAHSADDLRSQHFTSFVDFQTVAALAHLPEYDPERTFLRFPRDLRLDDLKNASAILIGSVGSNPWASITESSANFRIVYRQGMQGATIVNMRPQQGEAASYVSRWNEPAHETYALIAFMPNLGGNGHLLLLQGLDVAGTQAAAETLFHPAAIAPILQQATRPDGSLRFFEILLRSTSIDSNSTGTKVVASRIY
ncbi:MAG TPA: hypothetical protein VGT08_15055 [Terracidiphilus sp.]|nr:hypothetical protein [Terracidiphilus sp.]